ncbi:hypothetical protein MJH12_09395 [bacterium]|nr:hypothetical protein [bacterium]
MKNKLLILQMVICFTLSTQITNAYNFRSRVNKESKDYQRVQGSNEAAFDSRADQRKVQYTSRRRISKPPVYREELKKSTSFGFDQFQKKESVNPRNMNQARRTMSRGPQKRSLKQSNKRRPVENYRAKKQEFKKRKVVKPIASGYRGEFYGGGNSLFEVDPGLIHRWSKPGLIVSKRKR